MKPDEGHTYEGHSYECCHQVSLQEAQCSMPDVLQYYYDMDISDSVQEDDVTLDSVISSVVVKKVGVLTAEYLYLIVVNST